MKILCVLLNFHHFLYISCSNTGKFFSFSSSLFNDLIFFKYLTFRKKYVSITTKRNINNEIKRKKYKGKVIDKSFIKEKVTGIERDSKFSKTKTEEPNITIKIKIILIYFNCKSFSKGYFLVNDILLKSFLKIS